MRLPLSADTILLSAWIQLLAADGGCDEIIIAVRNSSSRSQMTEILNRVDHPLVASGDVLVHADPQSHRGTAGVARDLLGKSRTVESVLLVEGHLLPPVTLRPLIRRLDEGVSVAIGSSNDLCTAGVMAFDRNVLHEVPEIGYFDFKEQLIPKLVMNSREIVAQEISHRTIRINTLDSYIEAVLSWNQMNQSSMPLIAAGAVVSDDAHILGSSIIEEDVQISESALIQDSVIMSGAEIGEGAVIARSVVGPNARVSSVDHVVDRVLAESSMSDDFSRGLLRKFRGTNMRTVTR